MNSDKWGFTSATAAVGVLMYLVGKLVGVAQAVFDATYYAPISILDLFLVGLIVGTAAGIVLYPRTKMRDYVYLSLLFTVAVSISFQFGAWVGIGLFVPILSLSLGAGFLVAAVVTDMFSFSSRKAPTPHRG